MNEINADNHHCHQLRSAPTQPIWYNILPPTVPYQQQISSYCKFGECSSKPSLVCVSTPPPLLFSIVILKKWATPILSSMYMFYNPEILCALNLGKVTTLQTIECVMRVLLNQLISIFYCLGLDIYSYSKIRDNTEKYMWCESLLYVCYSSSLLLLWTATIPQYWWYHHLPICPIIILETDQTTLILNL